MNKEEVITLIFQALAEIDSTRAESIELKDGIITTKISGHIYKIIVKEEK